MTKFNLEIPTWELVLQVWVMRDTVELALGGKVLKLKGSYFCRAQNSSSSARRAPFRAQWR